MPLSSQQHTPRLMGEDEHSIKYGCEPDSYEAEGQETREVDGVLVTVGKRKADGKTGVVSASFKKPDYDSEKAAAWMARQDFAIEPAELHTVKGVEIFSTGLWNGKQISDADLDAIVDAYAATKDTVAPHLKLGHDDDQKLLQADGFPAAGWVENVRKVGSKLVADFVDIPRKIYQLIQNRAYRKVSCEIYNNIDIEGRKFPKMLGAVALLGSDLPGVLNLSDILSLYSGQHAHASIENFAKRETADVISIVEASTTTEHEDMAQADVDTFKARAEEAEKAAAAAKAEAAAKDAEIEKYKAQAAAAEKARVEERAKAEAAKVDAFVTGLVAEKLCSKAMEPAVRALAGEAKETYSVGDKSLTRTELVKQVLTLAKEAAKVNFSETTKDEGAAAAKDLGAKIEKYAAEHKVSYSAAYKAVTRGVDLPAAAMREEDAA